MKSKSETIEAVREFNIALETVANRLKTFKIDENRFEDALDLENDGTSEAGKTKFNDKTILTKIPLSVASALPYASWSEELIKAAGKLANILYPGVGKYVS